MVGARAVVERVIGPYTYKHVLLGAKAGRLMSVRIVKLLGPTLCGFIEGTVGGKRGGEASIALGASEAVREMVLRLHKDDIEGIQDELAKLTTVALDSEHEPRLSDIFDDHFAGHYDWMLEWTAFVLEANFKSFFAGAGIAALVNKAMAMISALPSQPTSTGTSTASQPAASTHQA